MNIQDAKAIITAAREANDSVLLIGLHGIGKTDIVKEWCNENNAHLEILHLSIQEPGDLAGIPYNKIDENGNEIEYWSVPAWLSNLYKAANKGMKTVLFLDELSRAPLDTRQIALQLVLDKKVHQHTLPKGTMVIAADNPDNGDYQVESLDPALKDRFLILNIDVDVKAWLDYAKKHNVNKIVRSFIEENPNKLYFIPEEGAVDDITATPRSWTKLAAYIDNIKNVPRELWYSIIKGKIGSALAAQFLQYMNNYKERVSIEDIEQLVNKLKDKHIEDIGNAVNELIKKLEVSQKTELTESLIIKYIDKNDAYDVLPMMGMLYGLEIEILASILKKQKSNNFENYQKIANFDAVLNDKGLFKRLVSKLSYS